MNKQSRFKRIEELFHAAQHLPRAERTGFLARECGADASLRSEVESLLAADPGDTVGVKRNLAASLGASPAFLKAGEIVGPYRIGELIGEGGMGEVYRAEQLRPLQREVALKVVKAGMDTRQVLERFENERQALAVMNHPGIARVFDAGATPAGRLFFAMELVQGEPVTVYCDARRLSLSERLELFQRVCAAVQHAHQKGIIHRDLKPSNILIEEQDGRARPKIIDFGIAKVVAPEAGVRYRTTTRIGQPVGTPDYMSPEQADPAAAIDTRTDVYSLGLVLRELLTGKLPSPRGLAPSTPRRALSGDLHWIVAKALEEEPERRYASASELAADVGRHIRDEPVLAGPPSRVYRAGKFVRRHRWGVGTAAMIVLTLLIAIWGIAAALVRARHAEEDALRQATVANEVTEFLAGLFAAEDPYRAEPGERTVRAIANEAAQQLEAGGVEDPEVFGRLVVSLASVMLNQGLREEAYELTNGAIERLREVNADNGPSYLELLYQRSRAETLLLRYDEARRTARQLVALAPAILPPDSPRFGVYLKQRGDAEITPGGTHAEQLFWHRRAMAALREAPEASVEDLGSVLHAVAWSTTDPIECEELASEELEIWQQRFGAEHPRVAEARMGLGRCARLVGDTETAQRQFSEAFALRRKALGSQHPLTLESTYFQLDALYELGRFEEAKRFADDVLAAAREAGQQSVIATLHNQSFTYLPATADFAAYRRRLEEAVTIFSELHGADSEWTLMARHTLTDGYANAGLMETARERYLELVHTREQLTLHPNVFHALLLENLATSERRLALFTEAEEHIDQALEIYPSVGWDPRNHARAWLSKATLQFVRGNLAEADAAFARAAEIYAACRGPRTYLDLRYEAAWRAARGERDRARELVLSMYQMGVHPDFMAHEPELAALFGEADLRRMSLRP